MVLEWLHHGNWSVPNKSGKVELKDSQGSNYKDSVGSKLAIHNRWGILAPTCPTICRDR
jgi:hypothetical protein